MSCRERPDGGSTDLAQLTLASPRGLAPLVIWISMLAAYMTTNSVADLVVVLIFAVLGMFMDNGFDGVIDTPEARRRFAEIFGFTVGLALTIRVFGFHVGATVLLAAYLRTMSRLSPW